MGVPVVGAAVGLLVVGADDVVKCRSLARSDEGSSAAAPDTRRSDVGPLDPSVSVPKLSIGSCDNGMSADMSVVRLPDVQPSPDGETLSVRSLCDEGAAVREKGRSVMFSPRRDGRRVRVCVACTGLRVGVFVAALRDGISVAGLRVGTCVTGAGLRVAISGAVAMGRNETPVDVPFTALLAPPGLAVLVGASVRTAVCVVLGPAITLMLGSCDGSGVATTTGAVEGSAVGVAVRS